MVIAALGGSPGQTKADMQREPPRQIPFEPEPPSEASPQAVIDVSLGEAPIDVVAKSIVFDLGAQK
jgi:hypothetical protein